MGDHNHRPPDAARAQLDRSEAMMGVVLFEEMMRDAHGRAWRVVLREEAAAIVPGITGAPPE